MSQTLRAIYKFSLLASVILAQLSCASKPEPTPSDIPTPSPSVASEVTSSRPPLDQLVDLLRSDEFEGWDNAQLLAEQAMIDSLPGPLTDESSYLGGTPIPQALVPHLNRLVTQDSDPWPSSQIEKLNSPINKSADSQMTISAPIQIEGSDRWYSLVQDYRIDPETKMPRIRRAGVMSFALKAGKVVEPEVNLFLAASSVAPRRWEPSKPEGTATPSEG